MKRARGLPVHLRLARSLRLAGILLCLVPGCVPADTPFTPAGLYEVEHLVLPNGLRLILRPRSGARTVAVRLVVGIGSEHFPCDKRETAHFLEHLLFAGTTRHDESELDSIIEDNGGYWNATTGDVETVYEVGIFSGKADVAITVLHEILTDSLLSLQDVGITRDIIHRELGGRPSALRKWLYRRGVGKSGGQRATEALFPGGHAVCPGLDTADGVERTDLVTALERWYVPGNMVLVVVGDFELEPMLERIRASFGRIEATPVPPPLGVLQAPALGGDTFSGFLAPLIGAEASVGMAFRVPPAYSDEEFPLQVLEAYLAKRLYNAIRVERGLAYAPEVDYERTPRYGLFVLSANVDPEYMDAAIEVMRFELTAIGRGEVDPETLRRTVHALLLVEAKGIESNTGVADYYAAVHGELAAFGHLRDSVPGLQAVTAQQLRQVAAAYLAPGSATIYRDTPAFSHAQVYAGIVLLLLLPLAPLWWLFQRHRDRRA